MGDFFWEEVAKQSNRSDLIRLEENLRNIELEEIIQQINDEVFIASLSGESEIKPLAERLIIYLEKLKEKVK